MRHACGVNGRDVSLPTGTKTHGNPKTFWATIGYELPGTISEALANSSVVSGSLPASLDCPIQGFGDCAHYGDPPAIPMNPVAPSAARLPLLSCTVAPKSAL